MGSKLFDLFDLFAKMDVLELSNAKYYKLLDFCDVLSHLCEADVEIDECIITPFYICDQRVLELYDYELRILKVSKPNVENYILNITGKLNLEEVNPTIIEKLKKCYLEVQSPNKTLPVCELKRYTQFVRNSEEIKERILRYQNEFDEGKLFFEVY